MSMPVPGIALMLVKFFQYVADLYDSTASAGTYSVALVYTLLSKVVEPIEGGVIALHVMLVIEVHALKQPITILCMPLPMTTVFRLEHFQKHSVSRDFTPSGIVTLCNEVQSTKA